MYASIAVVNLDLATQLSLDCLGAQFTFYDSFLVAILLPVAASVALLAVTWHRLRGIPDRGQFAGLDEADRASALSMMTQEEEEEALAAELAVEVRRSRVESQSWKVFLFGLFLVYPSLSGWLRPQSPISTLTLVWVCVFPQPTL